MHLIAIGNFDGVHRGHQHLFQVGVDALGAREGGGGGLRVTAVTFEPLPIAVLKPERPMGRLTPASERAELLRTHCNAQEVIELLPTAELLGRSPRAFIEQLRAETPFDAVVEGPDFRFGRDRSGSVETLAELASEFGFQVIIAAPKTVVLPSGERVEARSSVARALLAEGRVAVAASVFGRPYELRCPTTRGDQRGRTIGWPTANLDTRGRIVPGDGVYAGSATLPDGSRAIAAISIGTKPTFGGSERTCETTLLTPSGSPLDLPLDWYGWTIRLRFHAWIRGQVRFASLDALRDEMERDRASVLAAMAALPAV